ncbi:hypothetical protein, partial [Bradyrhizobium sp.]|uniref:hypothetical protein n=1 Tax=Bradyrhizobium sp. TaxID=376 RepID=UPI00239E44C2
MKLLTSVTVRVEQTCQTSEFYSTLGIVLLPLNPFSYRLCWTALASKCGCLSKAVLNEMMPPETEVNPGATQLNPSCDSALPRTGDFAVIKAHGA